VLDLGADDYIVKPFDPAVLLSRVNGVFRRLKVMAA
jgi:DNA-binding response OmpR family regulator